MPDRITIKDLEEKVDNINDYLSKDNQLHIGGRYGKKCVDIYKKKEPVDQLVNWGFCGSSSEVYKYLEGLQNGIMLKKKMDDI